MKYQIPGKTFLTGEYSVLIGGAALGLATKPYFEVSYFNSTNSESIFHSQSAAGKYLQMNKSKYQFSIEDSYSKKNIQGGFGRSGAEFLTAILPENKSFHEILKNYRSITSDQKIKPSGVDLAFQYFGQVCLADISKDKYESFEWPFSNLHFFILSTGLKIKTHLHLNELNVEKLKHLPELSQVVIQSFLEKNEKEFLANLKIWSDELNKCGLQLPEAWKMKLSLEKHSEVLLVKPCGALGADVLLVFCRNENKKTVENLLITKNICIVAQNQDLTKGLVSYVG